MARKSRYIAALALVLCLCAVLASCSEKNKFTMKDGMYVNNTTNIAYHDAPGCYEPLFIGEELYGKIGDVELFEVVGADTNEWLCDASGTLFYADGIELPTVDKLNTAYMSLVYEEETVAKVTDKEFIARVAGAYVNGATLEKPYWTSEMFDINWRIKFVDESRGICYILEYYELTEAYLVSDGNGGNTDYGKRFIYNRFEEKLVAVDDMLASYVADYKVQNGEA